MIRYSYSTVRVQNSELREDACITVAAPSAQRINAMGTIFFSARNPVDRIGLLRLAACLLRQELFFALGQQTTKVNSTLGYSNIAVHKPVLDCDSTYNSILDVVDTLVTLNFFGGELGYCC